jgi:hypothetical protein
LTMIISSWVVFSWLPMLGATGRKAPSCGDKNGQNTC